ncbi:30S ribosomal protein S1 [Bacteroidetes/Chlorobi group bacterium MS-B_bin-24]|nr:MAG: 30S ribosomal protein S1 [Bacteroidetes/Chlorobi group bacterium MS-B_bin-24]
MKVPTKPSVLANLLDMNFSDLEIDEKTFSELIEKNFKDIKEGQLIRGKIVDITKDEVFVDLGFKSVGVIPRSELLNSETLKIGDQIDVFVEALEDSQGRVLLSRKRADFMRIWQEINRIYENQEVVPVRILRRIKGGMVVDLLGVEAFLPGSQIDIRPVRDFDSWVGKTLDVKIVKVNHPNENVVVSHKVILEEQLKDQREALLSKLEKGLVLEGVVKAIADFGIFVDLGGVDGLVHITDLSWGRVTHPSEVVELDQKVKVVVLDFDPDKKRISLGMKQLTPHPWDSIGDKYEKGTKVRGKVVSLTDYGAFIEIEKGIEGLIHISEMSWTQHVKHPSQVVSLGQIVEAVVLNIDKEERKLALGMKQLEPDPWEELAEKYPVGSRHKGIVRNITNFGVFVELEPGVDGLIHISDLSWTKKIRHPGEFVKKGEELEVVVLAVDKEQRRIALGHKQIQEDPWDYFEQKYKVGTLTEGKIERIIEKGVIVELPDGVDGFVPVSQLSFAPVRVISDYFKIGDRLPLRVVEFEKASKKIVLSAVEALRTMVQAAIDAYNAEHPVPNADKVVIDTSRSYFDSSEAADYEGIETKLQPDEHISSALYPSLVTSYTVPPAEPKDEPIIPRTEETAQVQSSESEQPSQSESLNVETTAESQVESGEVSVEFDLEIKPETPESEDKEPQQ